MRLEMNREDILLYADDILLLCETTQQTQEGIQIVEKWSIDNGMSLNKKKSGIVVFASRQSKKIPFMEFKKNDKQRKEWIPLKEEIYGVPIVSKYKYLGTLLDNKLTMKTQMNFIKNKADIMFPKIYPYIINATADGRRDIWVTMIRPLFNALMMLLHFEKATNQQEEAIRLWYYTFKLYLLLPKKNKSRIIR